MLPSGSKIPSEEGGGFDKFLSKGDELLVTLNSMAKTIDKLLKTLDRDKRTDRILDGMAATSKNLSEATAKLNQELTQIELKSTIRNLNEILKKINHGQGTLGALINDPALYDDAKALVGGANRSRIVRNLVRRTIKEGEEAYSDEAK
jgi:phospholipid/cholesterol/gamma-HCH transport system substrate-binding protein